MAGQAVGAAAAPKKLFGALLAGCRVPGDDRMDSRREGELCRAPELWSGKSGTEDVLWSWRCRKGLAVLASFVCDRRYMQLGTPCTTMYRVDQNCQSFELSPVKEHLLISSAVQ